MNADIGEEEKEIATEIHDFECEQYGAPLRVLRVLRGFISFFFPLLFKICVNPYYSLWKSQIFVVIFFSSSFFVPLRVTSWITPLFLFAVSSLSLCLRGEFFSSFWLRPRRALSIVVKKASSSFLSSSPRIRDLRVLRGFISFFFPLFFTICLNPFESVVKNASFSSFLFFLESVEICGFPVSSSFSFSQKSVKIRTTPLHFL
jgi:hypothetical protein